MDIDGLTAPLWRRRETQSIADACRAHLVVGILLREQDRDMGGDETRSARDEHILRLVIRRHGARGRAYQPTLRRQCVTTHDQHLSRLVSVTATGGSTGNSSFKGLIFFTW